MKRLLRDNVGNKGKLDTDTILRGLLQFRNTLEPDLGLSPAKVLLGRALRDTLPFKPTESAFSPSSPVSDDWKGYWEEKESALCHRLGRQVDKLDFGSMMLLPLVIGDVCRGQN